MDSRRAPTPAPPLKGRGYALDGRIRRWRGTVDDVGKAYILRVVTPKDGETVPNALFDRSYGEVE